ncbi:pre-mRNA cleavage and polyadenylation factor I component [Scheffersomyces xylosifermentans]|uniref:pre-mRNA cleavage and polyadenylation factor I component n=1 Tax=Scheffersomyces xylosifermentans TaxID=1304137 RepID=UPI00315DE4C0
MPMGPASGSGFSRDSFQHLLDTLTINSRTIINQLTAIAEKNTDYADVIAEMVENRIKRCVPQYKLFAIYLMDSMCKNIGNPYNIIYGRDIYQLFTETYSIVTDNRTRQSMINLFKTWGEIRTINGSEMFPKSKLDKIEAFIIRATTLSNSTGSSIAKPKNMVDLSTIDFSKLTPDMLLKESRILLQIVVNLIKELDRFEPDFRFLTESEKRLQHEKEQRRHQIISDINNISDSIVDDINIGHNGGIPNFSKNVRKYHMDLLAIRKELDSHSFEQDAFLKKFKVKLIDLKKKDRIRQEKLKRKRDRINYLKRNKVVISVECKPEFLENILGDVRDDPKLMSLINSWGKIPVITETHDAPAEEKDSEPALLTEIPTSLSDSLGFSFMDSFMSQVEPQRAANSENQQEGHNTFLSDMASTAQNNLEETQVHKPSDSSIIASDPRNESQLEEDIIIRPPTPINHSHTVENHPLTAHRDENQSSRPSFPSLSIPTSTKEEGRRFSLSDYKKHKTDNAGHTTSAIGISNNKVLKSSLKRTGSRIGSMKRVRFDL